MEELSPEGRALYELLKTEGSDRVSGRLRGALPRPQEGNVELGEKNYMFH
jgi:hypothetical protein